MGGPEGGASRQPLKAITYHFGDELLTRYNLPLLYLQNNNSISTEFNVLFSSKKRETFLVCHFEEILFFKLYRNPNYYKNELVSVC